MILLSVDSLVKHFGPEPVLAGVTFDLRPGERVSLVGPNGAGKTTLMRIIAGSEEADSGRAELHSSATLGYLEQHPEFEPGRTVWDEAYSALADIAHLAQHAEQVAHAIAAETDEAERKKLEHRFEHLQHQLQHHDAYNLDHRIERVLEGLGFAKASFQQLVGQLSGGQQNRLLLAKLLLAEPDLMLLDEPSNHLDIDATQWLEEFLVASGQAILVVSHDRYFLDRVTNRTLELYQGTVESYPGNFTQYTRLKAERLEVQRRTYEKQREEIAKIEDFIRRNAYGQLAAQAEDRRKKLARIELVPPPREIAAPPMGFPPASRTGDIVLRVEHLTKGFVPGQPLFEDLSLDILRGEKWGILGPNGSGKTTLLKCLLGLLPLDAGRVVFGTGVKIGYFDQMLTGVDPEAEAIDAVRPDHKEFVEQQRRDLLARFGVTGDMVFQKVGSLSGGERNRTALARLAASDANLLILDEPTNHLDLWARGSLERALKQFDGSVVFVSHDRYFLNQVATKLLIVEPATRGKRLRFRVIDGNYDTYLHFVKQGLAREARAGVAAKGGNGQPTAAPGKSASATSSADAPSGKPAKERRKRKFPYRKAADIEQEIAKREARIEEVNQLFAREEVLRDGARVKELTAELEAHRAALPALYEHWEEAAEMNG